MTAVSSLADLLRVEPGTSPDLAGTDTRGTPGFSGGKPDGRSALAALGEELAERQEQLFAEARAGVGERSVLLVLQGMDTSGKGGVVREVAGLIGAQGTSVTGFSAPTEVELAQHYLQRVREALPSPGVVGVFDRSHYEDVVVVRVDELVPESVWRPRFLEVVDLEAELSASGTSVVKVFLHISHAEQGERLERRLARPDKHWKYHPSDVDARARWDDYQQAWTEAMTRTSTAAAPWYVVPADRRWYARWAVASLLLGCLRDLDRAWPVADFDVAAEQERLAATHRS